MARWVGRVWGGSGCCVLWLSLVTVLCELLWFAARGEECVFTACVVLLSASDERERGGGRERRESEREREIYFTRIVV